MCKSRLRKRPLYKLSHNYTKKDQQPSAILVDQVDSSKKWIIMNCHIFSLKLWSVGKTCNKPQRDCRQKISDCTRIAPKPISVSLWIDVKIVRIFDGATKNFIRKTRIICKFKHRSICWMFLTLKSSFQIWSI